MITDEQMEDILCRSQVTDGDDCRVLHFANGQVLLDGYFSMANLKRMVMAWEQVQ